jgi:hypothetical protein
MESEMSTRREWMDEADALREHPRFMAEAEPRHLDTSWSLFERKLPRPEEIFVHLLRPSSIS